MASFDTDLLCFTNCYLALETGELERKDLWIDIKAGKIADLHVRYHSSLFQVEVAESWFDPVQQNFYDNRRRPATSIDLGGNILSAGLLDIQINGAYGVDFSIHDGTNAEYESGLARVAEKIVETGVTRSVAAILSVHLKVYTESFATSLLPTIIVSIMTTTQSSCMT